MKLNEEGLRKFTEIFEIKANSVILIEKEECMTVIINGVIILNLRKELFKEFFFESYVNLFNIVLCDTIISLKRSGEV